MSLPPYYFKVSLTCRMACIVLWWCIGEGSFRCSLNLSPKVLEISPMYSASQVRSPHWNQYMAPLLLNMGSLSLAETSRFLMVLLPLKWVCMPYLPQIFLMLLQRPCVYMKIWPLVLTIGSRLGSCSDLVVSPINDLLGGPGKPFSTLTKPILGIAEKFRIATHCFGPMGEGINYTKVCWGVGDCPNVDTGLCGQVSCIQWWTDSHQPLVTNAVQEGDGTIFLVILHCELDGRVNTVDVL